MEGADRVSRSVWQTDHHLHHHQQQQQPPSLNSIRSDSGMNSMEYWDYTVELECIGQTADPAVESECESEMNRQMLRRNKELEDCIKFQRETIQDQAMRIETSMLREMTDSRLKLCEQLERDVHSLEEENTKLREGAASDKARIQMLKLELEQCVQAIRDSELQQQHEDKLAGARNDEVRTHMEMERKAVEERELLTELAMSRMTDKMKLLEEENEERKQMLITMELQMERLREDRGENEELDMNNSPGVVLTVADSGVGSAGPECSCQCHMMSGESGEPPHARAHDGTQQGHQESRDQLISRLDTQYRELIDKYDKLLDIVNQPPDQTALTPGAVSLQEELGMLDSDTKEEEEEEEEVACCNTPEDGSESSGFCDSLSEGAVGLQDEESQTEITSIPSAQTHQTHQAHQALHHSIFAELFALIRQEI